MAKKRSSDKAKKLALVGLAIAFVGVIIYQIFIAGPAPRPPRPSSGNANRPAPVTSTALTPQKAAGTQESNPTSQSAVLQELLADQTPLDLSSFAREADASKPGPRGSIFGFYVKPPEPPKPKPPAPIKIQGLQPQTAVAGTPRKITLTVTAGNMPPDAGVFFDGSPHPSTRSGENQLKTEIEPTEYASRKTINVEVRSLSDPAALYSDPIQFIVQPAPDPPFRYIARLGNLNQPETNYGVFEMTGSKEIKRMKRGETIGGVWRIDAINTDSVDLTHIQYDIKRRVPLQEKPNR